MAFFHGEPPERQRFFRTIGFSPIAMLVTDPTQPDNPIQLANDAFCVLTGYPRSEVVGRNCRFLTGPGTDKAIRAEISLAIRDERPVLAEVLNYRRDGTPFRNGLMITPLFDPDGRARWFVGSQVDVGMGGATGLASRKADAALRVASLTSRQQQILALVAQGLLSKQIASELKISERTVEIHRAESLKRLSVSTTAEAIRLVIEAGL